MQAAAEPLLNEINTKKIDLQALQDQINVSNRYYYFINSIKKHAYNSIS